MVAAGAFATDRQQRVRRFAMASDLLRGGLIMARHCLLLQRGNHAPDATSSPTRTSASEHEQPQPQQEEDTHGGFQHPNCRGTTWMFLLDLVHPVHKTMLSPPADSIIMETMLPDPML